MHKDVWCPLPWVGMFVRPNGGVLMCCEVFGFHGSIYENTLQEIIEDNDVYVKTRKAMDNGEQAPACSQCWKREAEIGRSYRTWWVSKPGLERVGGITTKPQLKYLHIDFSNGCNMKCPMCSIHRSTGWIKDRRKLDAIQEEPITTSARWYTNVASSDDYTESSQQIDKSFVDENWDTIFNCKTIELSGGEPFYSKAAIYMLEKLAQYRYTGTIKIITNASLIEPYLDLLSNLRVSLVISAEGYGEYYEYLRPSIGTKFTFDDFNRIIDKMSKISLMSSSFSYGFAYVPQLLNIHNTMDWLNWARTKNTRSLIGPPISKPEFMQLRHYPNKDYKDNLIKQLQDFPPFSIEDVHITSTINELQQEADPKEHEAFIDFFGKLGKIRKVDYSKIYWI